MLRNYLKLAWRNLASNRVSSIINIGGLAVGMAVALLIGLWIHDELSFDRYHDNYERIGQVMTHNGRDGDNGTYSYLPEPVAAELRTTYGADFTYVVLSSGNDEHIIASGDKKFTQQGSYMQPQAPDMLTLHMRQGTRSGLNGLYTVMLSASLADRLFGKQAAIDRVVRLDNTTDLRVTGVYEDLPGNSSFSGVRFIAPWDLLLTTNDGVRKDQNDWTDNSFHIYAQLAPGADFDKVSAHIRNAERPHLDAGRLANDPALFVHPMRRWHLYSTFENRVIVTSEALKFVWFYGLIGGFVLLLACINFMNLSTARSERRAREVGIRKTMGSVRAQLIAQFFCESLLTVLLAFGICLALVWTLLPWFDGVAGKNLSIPTSNPAFWAAGGFFVLVTGVLAGSYPALYLSAFRPVKVLKGAFRAGRLAAIPRKVLVVFQFTVSIALVIGTLVLFRQIQFAKNRPVGYSREGLIQVRMTAPDYQGKYDILSSELKATGVVSSTAGSSLPVTETWSNTGGIAWQGMDPNMDVDFAVVQVSPEYGKTIGFQLTQGRDFSRDFPTDSAGFVINEAAAKYMGMTQAAGQTVRWTSFSDSTIKQYRILGVVKDIVMKSPFEHVKQTIFWMGGTPAWITIRIRPGVGAGAALPKIEAVFKKLVPSVPFAYTFVDEAYAAKFAAEERVGALASFFTALAIFISCLGLFGLASFMAEQRTKEIGVRKVLGASTLSIWQLLSLDFARLVVLSCLVAVPIAYVFMHRWLQQYQYRSNITWWLLALVGAGALAVTLLTVSYQAIRSALANPVKSLRTE